MSVCLAKRNSRIVYFDSNLVTLTGDEAEMFGENQAEISESSRNLWEEAQVPLGKD